MILSNNHTTYIHITIYHRGCGIIRKKYKYRWIGPSAVHTSRLRLNLCKNSNIKLRSNL